MLHYVLPLMTKSLRCEYVCKTVSLVGVQVFVIVEYECASARVLEPSRVNCRGLAPRLASTSTHTQGAHLSSA